MAEAQVETPTVESPVVEAEQAPSTEQPPAKTEQSTASTEVNSGSAEQMGVILSAAAANPALAEDPDIKQILELAKKAPAKPTEANPDGSKTETKAEESGVETKTEKLKTETKAEEVKTETESEKTKTEEPKKGKSDSVFFKEDKEDEVNKIEFKDIDAFNSHIEEKFSIKDATKFFTSVDKWRSQAQNTEEVQAKLDSITDSFAKMPDPIYNAYMLWSKAEPWEGAVKGVGVLDFGKAFNEYDTHKIVNYYFPGEYTQEDFTGEDKDSVVIKRAINLAKKQYESDKQTVEGQRASIVEDSDAQRERMKTSTASSVVDLKESFPSMGKAEIKKVESIMSGGDLSGLFFNDEGGYHKDAATKIAMMLFASKEITNANKRTKSSQDVLRDKVEAGNEKPPMTQSTQAKKPEVPEGMTKLYEELAPKMTY